MTGNRGNTTEQDLTVKVDYVRWLTDCDVCGFLSAAYRKEGTAKGMAIAHATSHPGHDALVIWLDVGETMFDAPHA